MLSYTPDVVNTPRHIAHGIQTKRHQLRMLAVEAWLEKQRSLYQARKREEEGSRQPRVKMHAKAEAQLLQYNTGRTCVVFHIERH